MDGVIKLFYQEVKNQPCIVCGKYGVDVAHITPLSRHAENGRRQWTSRSHKDERAFFAVPLCREHHNMVHQHGEEWLFEQVGREYPYAHALRTLAEVVS